MRDSTFTKRPMPKKRATPVGYNPTDLAGRMQGAAKSGGGIQAGAHPEFEAETPLEKAVRWGRGVVKRLRGGK